jgi:maltose O-acetyltransferase
MKFIGEGIKVYGEGEIIIGDHTYVDQFSFLQSAECCLIEIDKNCAISHNVKIYAISYVSDKDFIQVAQKVHKSNVKIGYGVWIGVNALINLRITIGDNVKKGANSVVAKDIPAYAIASGAPTQVIRFKNISCA